MDQAGKDGMTQIWGPQNMRAAKEEHFRQTVDKVVLLRSDKKVSVTGIQRRGKSMGRAGSLGLWVLMRSFYFLLEAMGSYGRLSHRSDSFCFVTYLLIKLELSEGSVVPLCP